MYMASSWACFFFFVDLSHFRNLRSFCFQVMEFCQGGELFDRLLEVGNFSENQA